MILVIMSEGKLQLSLEVTEFYSCSQGCKRCQGSAVDLFSPGEEAVRSQTKQSP